MNFIQIRSLISFICRFSGWNFKLSANLRSVSSLQFLFLFILTILKLLYKLIGKPFTRWVIFQIKKSKSSIPIASHILLVSDQHFEARLRCLRIKCSVQWYMAWKFFWERQTPLWLRTPQIEVKSFFPWKSNRML